MWYVLLYFVVCAAGVVAMHKSEKLDLLLDDLVVCTLLFPIILVGFIMEKCKGWSAISIFDFRDKGDKD